MSVASPRHAVGRYTLRLIIVGELRSRSRFFGGRGEDGVVTQHICNDNTANARYPTTFLLHDISATAFTATVQPTPCFYTAYMILQWLLQMTYILLHLLLRGISATRHLCFATLCYAIIRLLQCQLLSSLQIL